MTWLQLCSWVGAAGVLALLYLWDRIMATDLSWPEFDDSSAEVEALLQEAAGTDWELAEPEELTQAPTEEFVLPKLRAQGSLT